MIGLGRRWSSVFFFCWTGFGPNPRRHRNRFTDNTEYKSYPEMVLCWRARHALTAPKKERASKNVKKETTNHTRAAGGRGRGDRPVHEFRLRSHFGSSSTSVKASTKCFQGPCGATNTGSSGFETSNQGVLKHLNYDEQEPIRVWSPSRN